MAEAGDRSPLIKPLLERCLSLHAEDRPAASQALRAVEGLRADPCAYRPVGHGAGVLADRWFKVWHLGLRRERNMNGVPAVAPAPVFTEAQSMHWL